MKRLLAACALILTLGACAPAPGGGPTFRPPPVCWKYPANPANVAVQLSIQQAFGPYGQAVVDQAGRVACCESGWGPQAVNGQYRGLFQLGYNYNGTIAFYGGAVFDPFTNTQVARDSWVTRGGWAAFACKP